jgi:hypothetical protein
VIALPLSRVLNVVVLFPVVPSTGFNVGYISTISSIIQVNVQDEILLEEY